MVAYACNPSYLGGEGGRITVQGEPGQSRRPYLKNKLKNMAQVVEGLPGTCEALSSTPSTAVKFKKKDLKRGFKEGNIYKDTDRLSVPVSDGLAHGEGQL
jgi:hypothetical protein